ncbi:hypothetical protein [Arthrobacter sp. BE255]|uniref:hypothetical protein n=1 Tax=Arthrobacter sp. BE255 TaxID=2817721 RepID=UPI002856EAAD|nr:hypothetical protein [Arthrobacter sp. BE255]MDR7161383.1 hypothetical protein [Arthrobacter sp. BE255]
MGIKLDDELRKYARQVAPNDGMAKLLVKSRREFSRSIHTLIASGISPKDLTNVSDGLGRAALEAWAWLEREIPSLAASRRDLWMNFQEFQAQTTPLARDLRGRIERALDVAFGVCAPGERRVIVHHGFYFFTPPQWALFQLLRRIPSIDQIFIVHDDGANPAFESWRRFFTEEWGMPAPEEFKASSGDAAAESNVGPRGGALLQALRGETVFVDGLPERLSILECRSPAELVREWRRETVEAQGDLPIRFAGDAQSIERLVRRLGRDTDSGRVDLAQLPIGAFLLALHDCIKPINGGGAEVVLTSEALLDIAASGYLHPNEGRRPATEYVGALRRAMPFFAGCSTGEQWRERALNLHRLILAEVVPLGEKAAPSSDIERLRLAAGNPLRLVPWGDLSCDEAAGIADVVSLVVTLVGGIASRERIALKDHVRFIRSNLQHGMSNLDDEARLEIAAKVDGFSIGLDDEIDVDGLVDVVAMLLGRTAEFDAFGELETKLSGVRDLRGLDALGMRKVARDLHITNLSEGIFPSSVKAVGWPFRMEDIAGGEVDSITVEVLAARADNAALGDLYLLWLALEGVQPGNKVTLSWISDVGGERRNPSAVLSLLTLPPRLSCAIRIRAGGLPIDTIRPAVDMGAIRERPASPAQSVSTEDLALAVGKIPSRASASATACSRRLALQWILGPSHAFQSEHHHAMLHGNVIGAVVKLNRLTEDEARRAANDLWRHLTPGQRSSSYARRVVKVSRGSAAGQWVFTLAGKRSPADGPLDRAYQAAMTDAEAGVEEVAPFDSDYLPPGVDDSSICEYCPVRLSCLVWVQQDG